MRRVCLFFEDAVVILVMRLFLCLDAPVKAHCFVPHTNTSPHKSQNNTHAHTLSHMQMRLPTQR